MTLDIHFTRNKYKIFRLSVVKLFYQVTVIDIGEYDFGIKIPPPPKIDSLDTENKVITQCITWFAT